jgi:ubiquinone/menaquinone biosynthesis C-methylase UbiE
MSSPAERHAQDMVPAVFAAFAERTAAAAAPQRGEQVLDVACGSGIVARQIASLAGPTGQVVGLDLSETMPSVAEATSQRSGQAIE